MEKVTTAAVWIRVSTAEQETDNQVPDVEAFIKARGFTPGPRYELKDSAWDGGKENGEYQTKLKKALDDAWAHKFSVLVVWALDRLTRGGAEDLLSLLRRFRDRGVTVWSVQESWLNTTPEIQDVLIAFTGWNDQQRSKRQSARVRAGLARARANGKGKRGPDQKRAAHVTRSKAQQSRRKREAIASS